MPLDLLTLTKYLDYDSAATVAKPRLPTAVTPRKVGQSRQRRLNNAETYTNEDRNSLKMLWFRNNQGTSFACL
jgi:hypothetical protein